MLQPGASQSRCCERLLLSIKAVARVQRCTCVDAWLLQASGTLLPLLLLLLMTVAKLLLLLPKQGFAALAHKHTCCW